MPRPPATSYRFDADTLAEIDRLAGRLRTTATGVIREAVRRLHRAEIGPADGPKKNRKKSRTGIDSGNTRE